MNQQDQKNHNQLEILCALRAQDGVSQAEISSLLGLQPSTVSNLMGEIRSAGMVRTVAKGSSGSTGGKKADLLSLDPEYGCFGGFYLQNGVLTCKVLDFQEGILEEGRIGASFLEGAQMADALSQAIKRHRDHFPRYRGVGIAVSSIVTHTGDIVPSSFFKGSFPHILGTLREQYPELAIVAENDANSLVYYDYIKSRRSCANILHLLVRENPFTIGAGLILDGRIYRGKSGAAGEIPEGIIDGADHADAVLRLVQSIRQFLDLEIVYVSAAQGSELANALHQLPVEQDAPAVLIGNNAHAVNGAAMLAMQMHIEHRDTLAARRQE
jgi:hypothetical protein